MSLEVHRLYEIVFPTASHVYDVYSVLLVKWVLPVIVTLADHLEVPSSTLCLTAFICWAWASLLTPNTSRISSKISGLFRSRIFMRSFMAIMMLWVRSSAPILELFSAAPTKSKQTNKRICDKRSWQLFAHATQIEAYRKQFWHLNNKRYKL